MWSNNKGEWSEIYTFAYLLGSGVLYAADKDLNRMEGIYFPVIKIIREENAGQPINYHGGRTIKIYSGDKLLREVDRREFNAVVQKMREEIPKGGRTFEIPEAEEFFRSVYCTKVKAASNKKQDITLQLQDFHTGIAPVCGFSIKSYLGANPTLINPGENTNFIYIINGCTEAIKNEVNAIATRTKLIDKMNALIAAGCTFTLTDCLSRQFHENLQFIDTLMPTFLNYMVLYSYQFKLKHSKAIIDKMKELNPLHFSNPEMYTYKFKKLLAAWALGLTPERTDWMGTEDANGGYITVKSDGDVVCYHLYNRTEFESYLFDYTYFDKPSTSKYHYFEIYEEDGVFKIKLSLQIRFR